MKRICIAVGHGKSAKGGYDPGACSGGYREFEIAKEIAKYTAQYLKSAGFETQLINYEGDLYLTDRIRKINAGNYDFAAEIHLNAGGGTGSEVYFPRGSEAGRTAAALISGSIANTLGIRDRGAKIKLNSARSDYFGIIRQTYPLTVLVETLFIDTDDIKKVCTTSGRDLCARAIAKGIEKYFCSGTPAEMRVKVLCDSLNVRSGPSTLHKINTVIPKGGVYTVTEVSDGWGRLRSGAGWINLSPSLVETEKAA
ncbi:MAG: N-acetylmuramoyl-L-alanine amidase [Clostridia bacterium]|nr:N-acetylmuramoyl-L-alanine amidase [Clostridia bacterium]